MRLASGGIDVYYIDESMDHDIFTMSAIPIPFLRPVDGTWTLVWEDHFRNARDWRRRAKERFGLPVRKELKGSKLAAGRGRYRHGEHQFTRTEAAGVLRFLLGALGFLQPAGIITVIGDRTSRLYGHTRLEALLFALLQRMRMACRSSRRQGMVFFDEGHGEYRKLYRKSRVFLPTGSSQGTWSSGGTVQNLPLDNFTKDANIKESHHCFFTQIADLVSYAAFLRIKGERRTLESWQAKTGLSSLYDAIPVSVLNTRASARDPRGIVRL